MTRDDDEHDICRHIGLRYFKDNFISIAIDRGPPVTPPPPTRGFFTVVIFEASEYEPIEIRLFAFKLLGLNMLKYAN